jgi:hypothetical protein
MRWNDKRSINMTKQIAPEHSTDINTTNSTTADTHELARRGRGRAFRSRLASRSRALGAITLLVVMMQAAAALLPAPANAASTVPGDFSSMIANNPKVWTIDNCRVEVGIVFDSVAYPNYRHVGGVRVNCSSVHSVITAIVALYYWTGSSWVQYGNGTFGARYGQAGSGTGLSGILRTPAYCVGNLNTLYWMVGTTVQTERTGATVYSNYSQTSDRSGC